jgi:long-chain acyl-CoA synthetase
VRLYICGGAPLPLSTLQAFEQVWGRPLCEGYGLSEAGPVVALNPPAGPRRAGSVGKPLPGVDVRIGPVPGAETPAPGEPGELLVRSPAVMNGYWNLPDETERVVRDGWLHTGDIARIDDDGYIYIVGRSKEMLIYRGMNIYPREIEEVLATVAGVREAAVIGLPDATRGEIPCAFVELNPGARVSEGDLRHACQRTLARYKVPRVIRVLESLPRNASGKVVKNTLREGVSRPSGTMHAG